jgi:AcrR family transcriptional regulator
MNTTATLTLAPSTLPPAPAPAPVALSPATRDGALTLAGQADSAKAADTRQRLVEAATNLFWEKGYAATGLSEVLKEAGARAGSLYHFFPTKELLLLAVLDHHKVILETVILRAGDAEADPARRAMAILGFYRTFMQRTQCALGCPIANLASEVSDTYPAARDKAAALLESFRTGVKQALSTGRGAITAARADELASLCVAALHGGLIQARAARSLTPLDSCLAGLSAVLSAETARGSSIDLRS